MMAQFIDVMDALDKKKNIKEVKEDIKKRREIYQDYIKETSASNDFLSLSLYYEICDFDVHLAYKIGLIDGIKIKNKCT